MARRMGQSIYIALATSAVVIGLLNITVGHWHATSTAAEKGAAARIPGNAGLFLDATVSSATAKVTAWQEPKEGGLMIDNPATINESSTALTITQLKPRPSLDSLVHEYNVTGDVSWLLDFAIVGFPKCGTSTLMYHLQNHPEVQIFTDERCDLAFNKQARLVRDLYTQFPKGDEYSRGLKCPLDVEQTTLGMPNYLKYFPHTRFLVGIRHPVLWFESFYNFRIHNEFNMPPANELMGKCRKGFFNLCTFRANFHIHLINLGKTPRTDDELRYVAKKWRKRSINPLPPNNRSVFLYEVTQLSDPVYEGQFRVDLQRYLDLHQAIPPMIWFKPGRNHTDEKVIRATAAKKINICDQQYSELRAILTEEAVNASRWIREYFVRAPGVMVSSPDRFVNELMPSWERDPCLDRK